MAALHARCFTVPRPWGASEFAEMLTSLHVFAVALPEGFAVVRVVADEAELLTIAVAPEARRRGLGRALLAEAEAGAVHRHAGRMFLEVADGNAAAIGLYRSAGYTESGRRTGYYRPPDAPRIDALILHKTLSAS